jgi:hypothetical protein
MCQSLNLFASGNLRPLANQVCLAAKERREQGLTAAAPRSLSFFPFIGPAMNFEGQLLRPYKTRVSRALQLQQWPL